ncbi:GNAT family N-acetyltransferase [Bacillus spongiae]|uniref:GNAT family N-acetyltransferase n=1 Tax=Bacillus spongiae TaxID=2683610 RepID=A0ABU8HHX3_9BACI
MKITETNDFQKIAQLNKSVQQLHAELYPDHFKKSTNEEVEAFFQSIIDFPQFIFLLASFAEEDIGYAWIEFRHYEETPFTKAYQTIYVHQISIDPTHKGKGYGSKLMSAIENFALQHGISKVELDYWVQNTVAKAFYETKGYQKYREVVCKELS